MKGSTDVWMEWRVLQMFRWSGGLQMFGWSGGSTDVWMEWSGLQMFGWSGGFYRCLDGEGGSTDV